ncbi:FtsB family cell division protein [Hydrogenovibrio kuenenii]|uniref:FtsB family cell division protein n=1 Tax=Hydrogenovibrio kuenenii TaxID=63658 RepID=UPI0004644E2A|nr:septum formation initiator family protein [Hydrogenovibrio kuenenii]
MRTVYVVLGAIVFLLSIRLLSSNGGISDYLSLQKKLDDLEVKVQQLESRNSELKKDVYVLQSNNKSIETIARQKLGMIGKDEAFVKVIELQPEAKPSDLKVPAKKSDLNSMKMTNSSNVAKSTPSH